jgi:hypothetical protein
MKSFIQGSFARVLVLTLAAGLAWASVACNQGQEGDRCNPLLSHDECNAGLTCQQPTNCPENYCCPASGTSSNPYCQAGCAGGLASICAVEPTYPACTDAAPQTSGEDAGGTSTVDSGKD